MITLYTLRPYQQEAIDASLELFEEHQALLLVLPTGSGKTVIASHIAKLFLNHGNVLWLAHREELIDQGHDALYDICGVKPEIEKAERWAQMHGFGKQIVCSTIQTQISGKQGGRMTRFDPNDFSLVVIDEGHHATADSYRAVIGHYKKNENVRILSMTATPDRTDEQALSQIFDAVAYDYQIYDAIREGWLVPVEQETVDVVGLDYSAIRANANELNQSELAEVLEAEEILHGMATPILDLCKDQKTIIFTATVWQAERLAEILNRHKPHSADFVCANTDTERRRDMFTAYHDDQFQYLCNVGICTEGWDCPDVRHIAVARATKSRSLYAQMLGRGLRPLPGVVDGFGPDENSERVKAIAKSDKPHCHVIDFKGNAGKHKLIHPVDVLGGKWADEVIQRAGENMARVKGQVDVLTELAKAERELLKQHHLRQGAEARQHIVARSRYVINGIDPFNILDVVPTKREAPWHRGRKPTEKMIDALKRFGIEPHPDITFTHASQLLDRLTYRIKNDLPSYRQTMWLRKVGFTQLEVEPLNFKQASRVLDRVKANKWRKPSQQEKFLWLWNAKHEETSNEQ